MKMCLTGKKNSINRAPTQNYDDFGEDLCFTDLEVMIQLFLLQNYSSFTPAINRNILSSLKILHLEDNHRFCLVYVRPPTERNCQPSLRTHSMFESRITGNRQLRSMRHTNLEFIMLTQSHETKSHYVTFLLLYVFKSRNMCNAQ